MKNKIFFVIFMFIWIILVVLNFVVPKISFSEQENRYLAKIPKFSFEKLVSGEYQEALDSYINDHFIFRNSWIRIKSQQERILGKTEYNGVIFGKEGYLFEKFEYGVTEEKNIEIASDVVNKFVNSLDVNAGFDVPVYFALVPNSIYINREMLSEHYEVPNQSEIIKNFYSNLDGRIKAIDVTEIMENNRDKYIYFKTDHHMTSNGAYLVYTEFTNVKGDDILPLEKYSPQIVSNEFLGTFDSKAQRFNQEKDYIVIYNNDYNTNIVEAKYDNEITKSIYNSDYLNKKDKYSFFLNGNNSNVVIKTKVENGKRILLIKDSYAHIMAQFLCNDYEEIHLIDPRYYRASITEYVKKNNIDEVLFLYNVSNLCTDVGIRNVK